jgi:hypothetical protein
MAEEPSSRPSTVSVPGSEPTFFEYAGGVGWLPSPDESLERCSHAFETTDGLWLLDPLDDPGLDDVLAEIAPATRGSVADDPTMGEGGGGEAVGEGGGGEAVGEGGGGPVADVAGVAVCSGWHARDAAALAVRYDVPVTVPSWIDRPLAHLDTPAGIDVDVQRVDERLPGTDVQLHRVSPMGLWEEAVCWRARTETLYVPESLGTARTFLVADERLGVSVYARAFPPRSLAEFDPERVLCGHGVGVFEDAASALADALAGSRKRAPRAWLVHGPRALRDLVAAARR